MKYITYQVIDITYQSFSKNMYDIYIFKIHIKFIIYNTSLIGYISNIYII